MNLVANVRRRIAVLVEKNLCGRYMEIGAFAFLFFVYIPITVCVIKSCFCAVVLLRVTAAKMFHVIVESPACIRHYGRKYTYIPLRPPSQRDRSTIRSHRNSAAARLQFSMRISGIKATH